MKIDNMLIILAVIALILPVANIVIMVGRMSELAFLTGYATSTGEVNLTVASNVEINFSTFSIDWGAGVVTYPTYSAASLNTSANDVTGGNWTAQGSGLLLDNIGNVNVTLDLAAGSTAASLLGGTGPDYEWNVSNSDATACVNSSDGTPEAAGFVTFADINTTGAGTRFCDRFNYATGMNTIEIDIYLLVPYNSKTGPRSDTITATADAA